MRAHFRSTRSLLAAAIAMAACSPAGSQSSRPARPVASPDCGTDPVLDGFVRAQTIRCAWGVASQCGFVGGAYEFGIGVGRDLRRAREYYRRACDLGSQDDCVELGLMVLKLDEKGGYPDVIPMWERACEKGSLAGCHAAGWGWALNAVELRVVTDVARGRKFLSKACGAGYMLSCGVEARLVVQTRETASYPNAQAGLIKACDLHERESCHFLAQTELHGTFGAKDEAAAASHFWEACRFGWGAGCGALAYLNSVGIGVPKDSDKARKLTDLTCKELHYEPACKAQTTADYARLAPEIP